MQNLMYFLMTYPSDQVSGRPQTLIASLLSSINCKIESAYSIGAEKSFYNIFKVLWEFGIMTQGMVKTVHILCEEELPDS